MYGFLASSKFFVVDAPGGPGLVDFLDERLRQLGVGPQPPTAVMLTSAGASETAGLGELIERCHVRVIASPRAIPSLRKSCPAGTVFLPADELSAKGWFPVSPITLEGRGLFPIAYQMELSGQRILFSGIIPVKLNQEVGERLISDLTNPPGEPGRYHASLMQLDPAGPNLWLPAIPTDDQNANLYGDDWVRILNENIDVVHFVEARRQRDR